MTRPMKNRIDQLTRFERVCLGQIGRQKTRRHEWKVSPQMMRLREIEAVIKARHGAMVPDPSDTDDRDFCLSYVLAAALSKLDGQSLTGWCSKWAPWVSGSEVADITAQADKRRRMITADGAAGLLMVTWEERTALGLKTIGACDISKAERRKVAKERKRDRDRTRQEQQRRQQGRKDRKSHAASTISTMKPWEDEGISRATWYRRQRETGVSRVVLDTIGDTFVSSAADDAIRSDIPPFHKPIADAAGDRSVGLGEHHPAELQEAAPHGSSNNNSQRAA